MREVAIVGAGGKMGTWFATYFSHRHIQMSAYDISSSAIPQNINGVRVCVSLRECVQTADLVLICVPVGQVPKVIGQCSKAMKSGAIISEISSVKAKVFPVLAKARKDLLPLCIHPMFGPGAKAGGHLKILLVPVRNQALETKMLRTIFGDAAIRVMPSSKAHDRAIAIVLGLTYFTNIVFAKVISRENLQLLKEISGTTFGLQSVLAESILTDEPDLIAALIRDNPSTLSIIERYLKEAVRLHLASRNNSKNLNAKLRSLQLQMQKKQDLQQSYRRLYEITASMKS